MRAPLRFRLALISAFSAASLLAGCGDDNNPAKPKPPVAPTYPVLSTPQNVLSALETAYSRRDSTEYRALYHYDYVGRSDDLLYGTTDTFHYVDEVSHIQALARATTIVSVDISFGAASSWARLPSDDLSHPEWAVIQISGSQLSLTVDDVLMGTLTVSGAQELMKFTFQPSTPESSSPTDTLWKIVRWDENPP